MEEKKEILADDQCPVCMQLFLNPAVTPCGHYYCLDCLTQILEMESKCPLCRTEISNSFQPICDSKKNEALLKKYHAEMNIRIEEAKKHEKDVLKVKFLYGNTHELIAVGPGEQNRHHWTCFVKCARNESEAGKYIKSVKFELHPTFQSPIRIRNKPPFEVSCIGWGYFTIPITIRWQDKFGYPDKIENHTLCFDGDGLEKTFFIEFNKKLLDDKKPQIESEKKD